MSKRETGKHLSNRDSTWVSEARKTGDSGEKTFAEHLRSLLSEQYSVIEKPPKLVVYPGGKGVVLDALIVNKNTGKSLYVENKAGDKGGNAHERVYKFLSPGLKDSVRETYNTVEQPFFLVFSGDTFQRDKYQNEFKLLLRDENYAIIEPEFANMKQIVEQIKEIV